MVTTRKMVESRLSTPRPDHEAVEPSWRPEASRRSRYLRGKRLLLLRSRYLAPGVPSPPRRAFRRAHAADGSPVTVAGPRRLLTGFPLSLGGPRPDYGGTILAGRTLAHQNMPLG
jgi:hypothetical protein